MHFIIGTTLVAGYCLYLVKIRFPIMICFQIDLITHPLLLWAWRQVKFFYSAPYSRIPLKQIVSHVDGLSDFSLQLLQFDA